LGPAVIKTFLSFKLTTEEKTDPAVIGQNFESHFIPAINRTFERYKFNQIIQKDGECFMEFATRLECQAQKCTDGDLEDTLIADRIVVGIYNERTKPCVKNYCKKRC
jgi:hypothetical protein